jgi:hypothetical protein
MSARNVASHSLRAPSGSAAIAAAMVSTPISGLKLLGAALHDQNVVAVDAVVVAPLPMQQPDFPIRRADRHQHAASPERYDLIVLDAFSSDAIPVHLLTRETFAGRHDGFERAFN